MDLHIRDLRVLVTAGASGIGLATVRAFVGEGARVHVCDIDGEALARLAEALPDCPLAVWAGETPQEFSAYIRSELAKWAGPIRASGVSIE